MNWGGFVKANLGAFVIVAAATLSADVTASLQRQIDATAAGGGGRVVVPPGRHGIHQLFLKSDVELHLSAGAELVSLQTPAEATGTEKADSTWFLIGGEGLHNVSITGQGRINGNGCAFWRKAPGVDYASDPLYGPQYGWIAGRPLGMVHFKNCRDVVLRDVELSDPPTYTVWLLGCDRGLVENVRITTDMAGPNTDGLDIDCCSDVTVTGCDIRTGDDAVALKSSLHHLGREKPCERITVRNCRLRSRWSGIRLGWEGDNPIRNCVFSNNVMNAHIGISLLTVTAAQGNVLKGTPIRDVIFRDNELDVGMVFQIRHGRVDGPQPPTGRMENVLIENTVARARFGSYVAGFPGNPIRNLTIRNLTMTMADDPACDFSANGGWVPPKTDAFKVPKSYTLPYGLAFSCVEGLRLENYRMVTAHPEWWLRDVRDFDTKEMR